MKDKEKDVLRKTPTELVNRSVGGEGCGEERARSMNWRTVATLGSKKLSERLKLTGQAVDGRSGLLWLEGEVRTIMNDQGDRVAYLEVHGISHGK